MAAQLFDLNVAPGRAPADVGVGLQAPLADQSEEPVQLVPEPDRCVQGGLAALEPQQGHGHRPALVHLAHDQIRLGHRAVEEHLVEVRVAGDVANRPDLDAGLIQRYQEHADAPVGRCVPVGPGQHEHPVGQVRAGGPQLLPGQHPPVAVGFGAQCQ